MADEVQVHGTTGQPVLLLPGGHVTCEGFYPGFIEGLVEDPGARVIVHDRPGTGTSTVDGTIAEATAHLHALVGALGMGPVVLVGQSLGGAVAALFAHDHPEDVAGIVLLDPTPFNEPWVVRRVERTFGMMAAAARVPLVRRAITRRLEATGEAEITRLGLRGEHAEALRRNTAIDVRGLARSLRGLSRVAEGFRERDLPRGIPAAVVSADHRRDAMGTAAMAAHDRLADAFGVPVTRWPGSTHSVHLDHPDETLEVIRAVTREAARRP